jgi:Ca2+-binding EF-hand superfamily protein
VFDRSLILISAIAVAAASPAAAAAAPAKARPAPKASAPRAPSAATETITRAALINGVDNSFKAADANHDGVLTQAEVAAAQEKGVQQRLAQIRAGLEADFTKLDTNHDGQLSMAEFMAAAPHSPATAPNGSEALASFDKNRDGKISLDEFRAPRLAAFDKLDTNHDGTLSAAERAAASASASRKR